LAVGYWKNTDELKQNWAVAHTWKPDMDASRREQLYKGWQKAVTKSYAWMD
jgi:glycerol kinase